MLISDETGTIGHPAARDSNLESMELWDSQSGYSLYSTQHGTVHTTRTVP